MQVTFHGVRGSIPTPGADHVKYGGNTACVHVELSDGTDIILDAGTGIRLLGDKLNRKTQPIHLLLSHNHWDHIQGFPFFTPIYQPNREIFITPGQVQDGQHDAVLKQMHGSLFPVPHDKLPANIQLQVPDSDSWQIGSATVSRLPINHPGGGSAYCIEADNAKLAYITDNELYPPYKKQTDFLEFVDFAMHADLIIHDAQYELADMPAKSGWGHSVAEEAVKLAMACRAKRMALYSHDPSRDDENIEKMEAHCQELTEIVQADIQLFAAAEGMVVTMAKNL